VPGGDDCTVFHCSENLARELTGQHDRAQPTFGIPSAAVAPATLAAHQTLRVAIRDGRASALEIEETSLSILRSVFKREKVSACPMRESTIKSRQRLVNETKLVLASRPTEPMTLSALARTVASSPFHLSRVFRQEVGMPIHQYVLRLRLALALDRLANGARDLSPLALELGFSSHSHFATLFKRTFGAPPSAFRVS